VKDEPEFARPPVNLRRGGNNISRQQHRRAGGALQIPKPEVKEEQNDDEAVKVAQLVEYER
jgi:hypothetical protein